MRIPFTDVRVFETPTGDLASVQSGSSGADGESHYADVYGLGTTGETNPIFRTRTRFLLYNEMRSDPIIRSLLWLYKLPIRGATWEVTPAGKGRDPVDRAVADAVAWQLGIGDHDGQLSVSWDEWLTQRMLCLDWGAVFEEIIWQDDLEWWRDPTDQQQRLLRPIGRMGLRRPSSISKIDWNETTGQIRVVEQDLPNVKPIPGDRIAHYSVERDGEFDWMGTSLLRSLYGAFKLKRALMVSSAIAWDRWSSGLPVVRYPSGGGLEKERRAEKIGENVRTHERAYVAFEGTPEQGWDLDVKTSSINDPIGLLRFYNEEMRAGTLVMFAGLGTTEHGSRAVGETLADPYHGALTAVASQIARVSTRDVVKRFVDVNFGTAVDDPKIVCRKISEHSALSVINALSLLSGAGFRIQHPRVLDSVMEMLDLGGMLDGDQVVAEGEDVFPGASRDGEESPAARRAAGRSAGTVRAALRGGGVPGALG